MGTRLNLFFVRSIQFGFIAFSFFIVKTSQALVPFQPPEMGAEGVNARIASGFPANESFEWMASLRSPLGTAFCGAVLIDEFHLLSAAHCVAQYIPDDFSVVFDANTQDEEIYAVERVWIPSAFRWSQLSQDIAVIRLSERVNDRQGVEIADPVEFVGLEDGRLLTVLGFGQTITQGGLSQELRQGQVPYVNPQTCADAWQSEFPSLASIIRNESICASGMGNLVDTCLGDSGGPLLLERDGWRLVGITSFGESTCGGAAKPSVYLNPSAFAIEIEKAVQGEAYYGNWAQALIGDDPLSNQITLIIKNTSSEPWDIENISEATPPFDVSPASTCENQSLQAGESCEFTVQFNPETPGFKRHRYVLNRAGMDPIWVDLQGFAFEYIPASRFGDQGIYGFAGGEAAPLQLEEGGISEGGYLQWQQMEPLDESELYIGVESTKTITLFLDYVPPEGYEAMPTLEIRTLNQYDEEIVLNLDLQPGWQYQTIELQEDDFLYVRVQAKGRGLQGALKLDFAEGETANPDVISFDSPQIGQNTNLQPKEVGFDSGGSLGAGFSFIALIGAFIRFYMIKKSKGFKK